MPGDVMQVVITTIKSRFSPLHRHLWLPDAKSQYMD
jgi:hypothetical protein